jgi:formyl-CoA transferase
MGGLRHLTGEPGRVPVRVGVSLGDTLAALHGVIGVLMALHHRHVHGGPGQVVDVALYEAVFNVMESLVPEYDAFGVVRERAGSALPGIAPTNAYPCADGQYILVAGNGDSIFRRLMRAIGRTDLETDPALRHNDGRVQRAEELDAAIAAWTRGRSREEVLRVLDEAQVPAGKIYSVADIVADPQYQARGMIVEGRSSDGGTVRMPGVVPKLGATPGAVVHAAPRLGEHDDDLARLRHAHGDPGASAWPARAPRPQPDPQGVRP